MKRILIILLLFANAAFGQNQGVSIISGSHHKFARINFTTSGTPSTTPGWSDQLIQNEGSTQSIGSTGWGCLIDAANSNPTIGLHQSSAFAYSDADFPDDVNLTYMRNTPAGAGNHIQVVISGLNPHKHYKLLICIAASTSSPVPITTTVNGGTPQTAAATLHVMYKLVFFTVPDGSGNVTIVNSVATSGFTCLNALIMWEL